MMCLYNCTNEAVQPQKFVLRGIIYSRDEFVFMVSTWVKGAKVHKYHKTFGKILTTRYVKLGKAT